MTAFTQYGRKIHEGRWDGLKDKLAHGMSHRVVCRNKHSFWIKDLAGDPPHVSVELFESVNIPELAEYGVKGVFESPTLYKTYRKVPLMLVTTLIVIPSGGTDDELFLAALKE